MVSPSNVPLPSASILISQKRGQTLSRDASSPFLARRRNLTDVSTNTSSSAGRLVVTVDEAFEGDIFFWNRKVIFLGRCNARLYRRAKETKKKQVLYLPLVQNLFCLSVQRPRHSDVISGTSNSRQRSVGVKWISPLG